MAKAEAAAGYTQLDEKGRLTLGKPVRQALRLQAGAILAWLKVGDAIMLVPVDAHLVGLMEDAAAAFERAHLSFDHLDEELARIREEVIHEHYGPDLLAEIRRVADTASRQ
jgi:bifunctional DNA-binding transcriptional regulator/antitoxin component of YhaV-PrlF toxin-antitoxin module